MTIIETLVQLRNDLKLWVTNNLRTKVDKEDGKGLSSNDFTTEEKEKIVTIEEDLIQHLTATPSSTDDVHGILAAIETHDTDPDAHESIRSVLETRAAQSDVDTINNTLNGYTDDDGNTVTGLVDEVGLIGTDLATHTTNFTNPHQVTAVQVGADPEGTAANLLSEHVSATNPHNITTDTIGAATTSALAETNAAVALKADITYVDGLIDELASGSDANAGAVQVNLDEHINDKNNPHSVTTAQIGAATEIDLVSHTTNTENPHGVTYEQAGADKSGAAAEALSSAKTYADEMKTAANSYTDGVFDDLRVTVVAHTTAENPHSISPAGIGAATQTDFDAHTEDIDIHITADERIAWNELDGSKINPNDYLWKKGTNVFTIVNVGTTAMSFSSSQTDTVTLSGEVTLNASGAIELVEPISTCALFEVGFHSGLYANIWGAVYYVNGVSNQWQQEEYDPETGNITNIIYWYEVSLNTLNVNGRTVESYVTTSDSEAPEDSDNTWYSSIGVVGDILNQSATTEDVTNAINNSLRGTTFRHVTIPAGQMLGDIDGDGIISQADYVAVMKHLTGSSPLTDEQLVVADVNQDGNVDVGDPAEMTQIITGIKYAGAYTELSGNWVNNPNYATEEAQFYCDITVSGVTETSDVVLEILNDVPSELFVKAVPFSNGIRLYVKGCRAEELTGRVIFAEGSGLGAITVVGNHPEEVFVATYGVTTYKEIAEAYYAGKVVICKDEKGYVFSLYYISQGVVIFAAVNTSIICYSSDDSWEAYTETLETTSNKTTTISADSTDDQYPSAKAVYDNISDALLLKNVTAALPSEEPWQSVAYGNGKFVAVVDDSAVAAYSTNGIIWTATTMPSSGRWMSVIYGNGKFVAVAYDSNIAAYSEDGITWTATTMPNSGYWQPVAYGNGVFVAVINGGTDAAYSIDGITWTATTMPSSADWQTVAYGNGKFVAIAYYSDVAAYSEDGITWTATTMPSFEEWFAVTHGNGMFVAVGCNTTTAAYSEDGITWIATTMPASRGWMVVTYNGNGMFVAVANGSKAAAYSTDGVNWAAAIMPSSLSWVSSIYGDGKFVVIPAYNSSVAISTDGINWSTEALRLVSPDGTDKTESTLAALNAINKNDYSDISESVREEIDAKFGNLLLRPVNPVELGPYDVGDENWVCDGNGDAYKIYKCLCGDETDYSYSGGVHNQNAYTAVLNKGRYSYGVWNQHYAYKLDHVTKQATMICDLSAYVGSAHATLSPLFDCVFCVDENYVYAAKHNTLPDHDADGNRNGTIYKFDHAGNLVNSYTNTGAEWTFGPNSGFDTGAGYTSIFSPYYSRRVFQSKDFIFIYHTGDITAAGSYSKRRNIHIISKSTLNVVTSLSGLWAGSGFVPLYNANGFMVQTTPSASMYSQYSYYSFYEGSTTTGSGFSLQANPVNVSFNGSMYYLEGLIRMINLDDEKVYYLAAFRDDYGTSGYKTVLCEDEINASTGAITINYLTPYDGTLSFGYEYYDPMLHDWHKGGRAYEVYPALVEPYDPVTLNSKFTMAPFFKTDDYYYFVRTLDNQVFKCKNEDQYVIDRVI